MAAGDEGQSQNQGPRPNHLLAVIPAKAGIQIRLACRNAVLNKSLTAGFRHFREDGASDDEN